jgi:tRNA pseudouridine38-40 synthase
MPTFKITLAYDGTDFVGWQRQAAGTSIQGLIEDALADLDERDVSVIGAGRTDAGVHALGQVASFTLHRSIDGEALVGALNARLPGAVRVLAASEVPDSFHARFGARSKTYRYRIWNAGVFNPFERTLAWHLPGALDRDAMAAAARLLEGRHDFAAFQAAGSVTVSTERELFSSRVLPAAAEGSRSAGGGEALEYEVSGSGFLRHMVRAIVGTLVEVGRRRRPVQWVRDVLMARDRALAGPTAPAQGLVLVRVVYDEDPLQLAAER